MLGLANIYLQMNFRNHTVTSVEMYMEHHHVAERNAGGQTDVKVTQDSQTIQYAKFSKDLHLLSLNVHELMKFYELFLMNYLKSRIYYILNKK